MVPSSFRSARTTKTIQENHHEGRSTGPRTDLRSIQQRVIVQNPANPITYSNIKVRLLTGIALERWAQIELNSSLS